MHLDICIIHGNGDGDFEVFVVHAIDHHISTKLIAVVSGSC